VKVIVVLPEVIRTERLLLRAPLLEDAADLFEGYGRDAEVARYMTWRPKQQVREMEEFIAGCVAAWRGGQRRPWVLTRKPAAVAIGMIELRLDGPRADLGYVLARDAWGQGLMSEAARAVVELALAQPGLYRVAAHCDAENMASARVLEKAGMVLEGVLRRYEVHPNLSEEPRDVLLSARTR
jgi:ribosomal-protein-alanine N-acetyltransferase